MPNIPQKYKKDSEQVYSYGTAGFRMNANLMKPVAFKVGILAGLMSCYYNGASVGVMVTASHNPIEDNGIKLVDPNGEMVTEQWEHLAARLANASDDGNDTISIIESICNELNINIQDKQIKVAVARDTRPSGEELCEAIEFGVRSLKSSAIYVNLGLLTTPQLHFSIRELNLENSTTEYIEHFSSAFEKILSGKKLSGHLVIDTANGIGCFSALAFSKRLQHSTNFDPILINTGATREDILNFKCGADYVKMQMVEPTGILNEWKNGNYRFASLDGDADRLIYFFFDDERNFTMLDGDRISVLFAFYLRKLLRDTGLDSKLKFGVVQTAYANGASTRFLQSNDISVKMACTGVKNLHHVATDEYDIGVYFEANGHGTVLFSQFATECIDSVGGKLKIVQQLINQCVGDAMSDLLFVEAILEEEKMTMSSWDSLYTELPNRQLKVKVNDRSIFKTTDSDTRLVNPSNIQAKIDVLVSSTPSGRAFVRPSGTEDVVRIYAEASTRDQCDLLADSIALLLK